MNLYKPSEVKSIIGQQIMYRHMAGEQTFGPVTVIDYNSGSDSLIVSGDLYAGRTFSLLLAVTSIELVKPQCPEVQP